MRKELYSLISKWLSKMAKQCKTIFILISSYNFFLNQSHRNHSNDSTSKCLSFACSNRYRWILSQCSNYSTNRTAHNQQSTNEISLDWSKSNFVFSSKSNLRLSVHFSQHLSIKHNVQSKSIHAKAFSIKVNRVKSKLSLHLNNADNWTMIGIFHVISKMHHNRYSWKSTRLWKQWMLNLNMMTSRKKNNCFLTYDRDLYFVVYLNWMIILHWILIKYH